MRPKFGGRRRPGSAERGAAVLHVRHEETRRDGGHGPCNGGRATVMSLHVIEHGGAARAPGAGAGQRGAAAVAGHHPRGRSRAPT
ncbi:hypothetical protein QJS66_21735 [Kocuria rhizophila]|nr:hypothetical protein QJS66_21735 [Kocuria rhizophila]